MQISKLDQMFEILKPRPNKRLVAAWAVDAHTIAPCIRRWRWILSREYWWAMKP